MKKSGYLLIVALMAGCTPAANDQSTLSPLEISELKEEARSVLPEGEARELVVANCVHCHGHRVLMQNRATRQGWKDMIVWMQQTQGLWPLGTGEDPILDYLAEHFAPGNQGRRAPLTDIEWYELE